MHVPFARAIDADIYYEDSGGTGPVVLLAHEFFMDRTMFAAQQAALAPEFRIVAWDARGHGRTKDQRLPFTFWTAARDALTVLDTIGAERAVVGGTAQGGFTALRTALVAPERVAALILISTEAHGPTREQSTATQRFLDEWHDRGSRAEAADRLADWLIGDDDSHRDVWTRRWVDDAHHGLDAAVGCLLGRDSVLDRLREITCPALIIHATHSGIAGDRARTLADGLTASSYLEIDGARLAVTMTHPEPVNAAIARFLRERVSLAHVR
ncbi:putative hydrolase [Nocardia asteroides NBRC 15531]|uniref:Hydrolase n=1 Tax=Nocardia asteroides NBRC 15531 TaxID=1110697 RepID=U5EQX9_NOCAS|nr:putative hydrolase [Nocardia asteroides NBRC 15531]SFM51698.1 Pimeloyl-ACP methyl ester carboxylesterase [Nocardia asteroides]VEG33419.1 Non-heme chloroperoxidase [Nocardia asteroides]